MSRRPSSSLPSWVASLDLSTSPDRAPSPEDARSSLVVRGDGPDLDVRRWGPSSRSAMLFDGFLYEMEDLARAVGVPEVPDRPSDLLLAGWQMEGTKLLDRLSGSFLLAVWDDEAGHGMVARDALGHHPLFYASVEGRLWFGPTVLDLARLLGRTRPDRASLALLLLIQRPPRGRTFFEGISRLEAGCCLDIRRGREARTYRYWHPVPSDDEDYLAPAEALEEFEARLEASVRERMRLAPDGIMLSGGLDSVCIAAVARGVAPRGDVSDLVAYSARRHPDDPPSYEEEAQVRVAERLGMRHVTRNQLELSGGRDLISSSLREIAQYPAPTHIPWAADYMALARFVAAQGHRIFLIGSGGDEWLTVSSIYSADLLRAFSFGRLWRMASAERFGQGLRWDDVANDLLWKHGLRALLSVWGSAIAPGLAASESARRLARTVPDGRFPDADMVDEVRVILGERRQPRLEEGRPPRFLYRQEARAVWDDSYLLHHHECEYYEQRLAGVLYLAPYHDRHLVEFLSRIDPCLLFADSQFKGMVRSLAARRLPGLGLERQQKTYSSRARYLTDSLERGLPLCLDEVGCRRLADLGLVDPESMRSAVSRVASASYGERVRLFAVLSAEAWLAANCDAPG